MMYLGDFLEDATLHFLWSTNDSNGASITRSGDGTIHVYKDNAAGTEVTTGITNAEDFDTLTGIHSCTIDLSSAAFYAAGANYTVILKAATIDTQTVNAVLAHFSIENRFTDVIAISGDKTAADNLESQYDTTGLTGDTFPASQNQLNQVANISGTAKRAAASYTLTTGTQSANTVAATAELDGTRHEHTDAAGEIDLYYEFNIGSGLPTEVKVTGYLQGNNDDLEVYGYDWVSASFKRIGTFAGQASSNDVVNTYDLLIDMVGFGANKGLVRVQFKDGAFTLTTATLAIDQILVAFTVGIEGYEGGAVWLDTNASNTNTIRGVDGIAGNPVSTIAAVNTLLAKTNLSRVKVAPQSSVTFAATQANQKFVGKNWTLALGGQSVSGSFIEGANVAGIGTGAAEVRFNHCHFANVTLPPSDCENCVLEGTFAIGTAGDFFFEDCKSGVAGTSTPIIDFGSALNSSNLNVRGYSGGVEIQNMGAGTGSYDMSLEGDGQLIINANCSATSTVAIRGNFTVTDNAGGAVTLSDDARYDQTQVLDAITDDLTRFSGADIAATLADVTGINGAAMRGTDGANTTVPDAAGTAATLHGTTDGKVDAVKVDTAAILIDTAVIGVAGVGLTDLGGMSTAMKAEVQVKANDAIIANNLDHLMKTAVVSNADMTAEVPDGTVLSNMLSKASDTSTFTVATDSLEGIVDGSSGNLSSILGTALTETNTGDLAGSFVKFNDVATPTKDINDVGAVASGGVARIE